MAQLQLRLRTWGGKRRKAGRPPRTHRSSERHTKRERFSRTTPVHVTLRVVERIGTLRRRDAYHAVRLATASTLARADFRIVHLSLERDHLHLIVEADHREALSAGVKAFESSAAQRLNRALSKTTHRKQRGTVFADRFHARIVRSPTQARHAIAYVLNNWRRHGQDQDIDTMFWDVDYFSSGPSFDGWREGPHQAPEGYQPLPIARPQSWLLAHGWRKTGEISWRQVPKAIA